MAEEMAVLGLQYVTVALLQVSNGENTVLTMQGKVAGIPASCIGERQRHGEEGEGDRSLVYMGTWVT